MQMRARRQELGLTLQDVADRVGYTKVHISDVERCLRAKPANGVKLARWYQVLGLSSGDVTERPEHTPEAVGSPETREKGPRIDSEAPERTNRHQETLEP